MLVLPVKIWRGERLQQLRVVTDPVTPKGVRLLRTSEVRCWWSRGPSVGKIKNTDANTGQSRLKFKLCCVLTL